MTESQNSTGEILFIFNEEIFKDKNELRLYARVRIHFF